MTDTDTSRLQLQLSAVGSANGHAIPGLQPYIARTDGRRYLFIFVGLLVIVFASRVVRLDTLEMDKDEVWSIWQTFGTPAQIVAWTPHDYTPLFYLIVGAWKELTGIRPFTLTLLPIFTFMVGMAILYRVTASVFDSRTALLTLVACAALGYATNISLMLRAYVFLFALTPLAWWWTVRYFRRPTVWRGLLLGLCLAALFYIHFTAIFFIGFLGLYSVIMYPRRVWRWWLPGIVSGVLALPQIISKSALATGKVSGGTPILTQWLASGAYVFFQNLQTLMQDFAGYNLALWSAFVLMATVIIFDIYRLQRRTLLLILWLLAPILLFSAQLFDAFTNRHLAWVMIGYAVWIAWGFSKLPRAAIIGFCAVLFVEMFGPVPIAARYKTVDAPLVSAYNYLSRHMGAGDVMLLDPGYNAVAPEEWDYFTRAYFPAGLNFVSEPGDKRRLWYVTSAKTDASPALADIQHNRALLAKWSQDNLALELYSAPPNIVGIPFENGMRFHGVESLDNTGPMLVRRNGDRIRLRLWWSVDRPLPLDYSVGTYVMDGDKVLAQFDGAPQLDGGASQTSRWVTGRYYVEEREFSLPYQLATSEFPIKLAVYYWQDHKPISAPAEDVNNLLTLLTVHIKAW